MRWPFRRKDATQAPEPAVSPPAPSGGGRETPPERRSMGQWVTLPPLPVTIRSSAPLVMGPAPVLPPLPGRRSVSAPRIAPASGRVEGLVHPVPVPPEPPAVAAEPPAPEPPAPLVHRAVRSGQSRPAAPLTDAVGPYVGEPREPAEPYRAPGWLRLVPEWLTQPQAEDPLGLPVSSPEPPRPAPKPAPVRQPVLPPSRVVEGPAVAEEPQPEAPAEVTSLPQRPRRRPSLGQSRRLGLGAPIKHLPEQELVLPQEQPRIEAPPTPRTVVRPSIPPAPAAPVTEAAGEPADEEPAPPPPPPPQPPPQPPPRATRPAEPVSPPAPQPPAPVERRAPSAVPLVYRSAPGKREPQPKRGTEAVPAGLADAIRGRHGVDVSDVPVHRGPEAAVAARSLGARAFTRGGEVFLPDDAGPLSTPKARGLLAHELVHVVQQRTLGSSLPSLSSPQGAALEAEAVRAEHEHAGHDHAPAPLVHPALTQVISQAARTVGVQLAPLDTGGGFTSVVSEPAPAPAPQLPPSTPDTGEALSVPARQEVDRISEANAIRMFEEMTSQSGGGTGGVTVVDSYNGGSSTSAVDQTVAAFGGTSSPEPAEPRSEAEQEMANQILHVLNLDRSSKGEPPLAALDAATMEQVRMTIAQQNAAVNRSVMFASASASATMAANQQELAVSDSGASQPERPAAAEREVPLDYTDELSDAEIGSARFERDPVLRNGLIDLERVDMEELSARLYDRLRSRLRLELMVDRERAGLLSDFR
jgi:hypothetical protein